MRQGSDERVLTRSNLGLAAKISSRDFHPSRAGPAMTKVLSAGQSARIWSILSALAGSAIGGLTSLAASWLTQRVQFSAHQLAHDIARREELYKEFIEQAKKTPKLNMGSAGAGTTLHMSAEWFRLATGLQAVHVPFKGSAPQVVALGGGEVDWAMENYGAVLPMVQTGRVRLLAVASPARHPQAPDVPTFKEAGLPDVNLATWIFLMAPAGTPDAVVAYALGESITRV